MKKAHLLSILSSVFLAFSLNAQSGKITGIVTDAEDSGPLIGAIITIEGTAIGTTTDGDGNYTLYVKAGTYTVRASYIGYSLYSEEVSVESGEEASLDIALQVAGSELEEVTVVGSRNASRSALTTAVPIDIIPLDQVTNASGQTDLQQILQFVAPSFNSNRQAGSDGSDHIDAASLRGLGPDQVLVLVNGKRRHTSSLINVFGSRGRGNVGTDLNTIPVSAIERIEVLRDGAAAQYGSDAIAGVINIVLKQNTGQAKAGLATGAYLEGDGLNVAGNFNYGLALGENGYANISGEAVYRDSTNRAPEGNPRTIGDARVQNASMFFNTGYNISENAEVYAFGGMNFRFGYAGAWYRGPDELHRNNPLIYPNGFVPQINTRLTDQSFGVGIKGRMSGWQVDFSNTFGRNTMRYRVERTLNASMGNATKTSFDAGGFDFSQNTTNLDFSRKFDVLQGINVGFGAEYRVDNYKIIAGEEASWQNFAPDSVVNEGGELVAVQGGAQGFPGFRPSNELDRSRSNIAAYVDAEFDFTESFMLNAAVRGERYSDFGNTLNGKLALRYSFGDKFAIRASASTGFRAPSLQQSYFNTIYTDFIGGVASEVILTPNNSNIARALGIPELKEEKSLNFTLGITTKPISGFSVTLDAYMVGIQDRIVLTGYFSEDDPDIGSILQDLNVSQAAFFTNAIDTRTYGVDLIATYNHFFGEHNLGLILAFNYNQTKQIGDVKTSALLAGKEDIYFGDRERLFLEGSAPAMKGNFTVNYAYKRFSAQYRGVLFGKVVMGTWSGEPVPNQIYNPKFVNDLSVSYRVNNNLTLTVGGNNITNQYPDAQNPDETETGGLYESVQMGFNGAYFFGRLGFVF